MINILPEFEARQVLTSDELNWLACYLDSQNRQSRRLLFGSGIIGGLQIVNNSNKSIDVSNGCALTSAGHILTLGNDEEFTSFTKIKEYKPNDREVLSFHYLADSNEGENDYSKSTEDATLYFKLFKSPVFELFEDNYNDAEDINFDSLEGKVAIAFAEIIQTELKNCEEDNCQDRGKKYTFRTKILLISKDDATNLLCHQLNLLKDQSEMISNKAFPWLHIKNLDILKPIFSNIIGNFTEKLISDEYDRCIDDLDRKIMNDGTSIDSGLAGIIEFVCLRNFSIELSENLQSIISQSKTSENKKNLYSSQIVYDYLWVIIKAYKEIQIVSQELRANSLIQTSAFPNHVLLGDILKSDEDFDSYLPAEQQLYRHPFYSKYVQTQQSLLSSRITLLLRRLKAILENFDKKSLSTNLQEKISITPGSSLYEPLSLHALPNYLNGDISKYWNQNGVHPYLKSYINSYDFADYQQSDSAKRNYQNTPLQYQAAHNFLRIENISGKLSTEALEQIFKIRKQHGLPFEVIMLRLNKLAPTNHSFNFSVNEDIESIYQIVRAELLKQLNLNLTYIGGLQFKEGKFNSTSKTIGDMLAKYFESNYYIGIIVQQQSYGTVAASAFPVTNAIQNMYVQNSNNNTQFIIPHNFILSGLLMSLFSSNTLEIFINNIQKEGRFKDIKPFNFFSSLLALSKTTAPIGSELFYKVLQLFSAMRLQELTLTENFSDFDLQKFTTLLNTELLIASDNLITLLKSSTADFIKSDDVLLEVVKGEILDYTDRIKFADNWIKMEQIDAENKKRNGGLGAENLFEKFVQLHPGISHGCGVPKGGTFIIVYNEKNTIAGDFYLPYILSSSLRPIQFTYLENKTITLSGSVLNEDGEPVFNAKIKNDGNIILSNEEGKYIILVNKDAKVVIQIRAENFNDLEETIVMESDSKSHDFILKRVSEITNTVEFFDEGKKKIITDIKLYTDEDKKVVALGGTMKVSGNKGQKFTFTLDEKEFKPTSFNIEIEEKDSTTTIDLYKNSSEAMRDTWILSDIHALTRIGNTLIFNGTSINLKSGNNAEIHSLNYKTEKLSVHSKDDASNKFVTDKLLLEQADSIIVFVKPQTKKIPVSSIPNVSSMQFLTFLKKLDIHELKFILGFNKSFTINSAIDYDKRNLYCLLLTAKEVDEFKKAIKI